MGNSFTKKENYYLTRFVLSSTSPSLHFGREKLVHRWFLLIKHGKEGHHLHLGVTDAWTGPVVK